LVPPRSTPIEYSGIAAAIITDTSAAPARHRASYQGRNAEAAECTNECGERHVYADKRVREAYDFAEVA
jgi:hypothetical protein